MKVRAAQTQLDQAQRAAQGLKFAMSPIEFIENPCLSEEIFDGEYAAVEQFAEIRSRFEQE